MELSEHLFRRESGRLVAALVRIFGVHNLALAEDVVQDAFCRALDVWKIRGVPDNPSAWLMTVAKRRALDVVRRERTARTFAPELARWLESEWTLAPAVDESFTSAVIRDEQLRMMFSCCHPSLSEETQIALILNVLCGFGASEVASGVSRQPRRDGEADYPRQEGARERRAAVRPRRRRLRRAVGRGALARCTCSSTRATTARPRKPRCARSCAARPFG